MAESKPNGRAIGWTSLRHEYLFRSPWRSLRRDRIAIAGRDEIDYTYLEIPPAIYVVPLTADGRIILIRQYRYPIDAWCLEVPAGGLHDHDDALLEDVVRVELRQEIGARCGAIEYIARFYPQAAHADTVSSVFLARDVVLDGPQALEPSESIEIRPMPVAEAMTLARGGQIADGASALALLLCEPALYRLGVLTPF